MPRVKYPSVRMGRRVQEMRKFRHFSTQEFADRLGISQAHVEGIESDQKTPSTGLLRRLCEELGCSADWLLGIGPRPVTLPPGDGPRGVGRTDG